MIKDGTLTCALTGTAIAALMLSTPANTANTTVLLKTVHGIDMTADTLGQITLTTTNPGSTAANLQTTAIRQGDTLLPVTPRDSTRSADSITINRGTATETITATADGAEQSWSFPHAPGTSGDLTISIQTTGLTYHDTTTNGLHLQQTDILDLSYSTGTWIDAHAHRWLVPARFEHGLILLTVPAQALAETTYPATLDPQIVVDPLT